MDVVGREVQLAAVLALTSGVLVVTGEDGAGKSTLLEVAADRSGVDRLVLSATGRAEEQMMPFSCLHQLLLPVLGGVDGLPARQRAALRAAFGLEDGTPDPMIIGVAVLTLLSELSGDVPLLILVDDIELIDECSRQVLAFVGRRIGLEPLAVVVSTRTPAAFSGFEALCLPALTADQAAALIDAQPSVPTGRSRERVLRLAAGNPLALIELSRVGAEEEIVPLTERLKQIYTEDLDRMPEKTRRALLLASADTADLVACVRSVDLAPAEMAGLIRFVGDRYQFRHPLVRSAIYHAVPLAERLAAHRTLATLFSDEPDRRAWHLAAASMHPDETVASLLEASATRAQARGGHDEASTVFDRAARLSPDPRQRARRLLAAAQEAAAIGQVQWVEQLAIEVRNLTDDPLMLASADLRTGQVLGLTLGHETSLPLLLSAAQEPTLRSEALSTAAVVVFLSGDAAARSAVRAAAGGDLWVSTLVHPQHDRAAAIIGLQKMVGAAESEPELAASVAVMAWLLDETAVAVRLFDKALNGWRAVGHTPTALHCSAGWAYMDHGMWAQARLAAARLHTTTSESGLAQLTASHLVLEATAAVLTGDITLGRTLVDRANNSAVFPPGRAVSARADWALGMAAVGENDHHTAYQKFRALFSKTGQPAHYHFSPLAIGDLVAAAVRTGHHAEGAKILQLTAESASPDPSARMRALLHRAQALLGDDGADTHFRQSLSDAQEGQWPFERAQTLLEYGEWLRRQRHIIEARTQLQAALSLFQKLGARPWLDRTHRELRAAGIHHEPLRPDAMSTLTPQQRQIANLAARGLTNREIGERLYLSPRTIGSHLYRMYPQLGITSRVELRDIVAASA